MCRLLIALSLILVPACVLAQADPFVIVEPELDDDFFALPQDQVEVDGDWPTDQLTLSEEQTVIIENALDAATVAAEVGGLDPRAYITMSSIWQVRTIPVCWEDATESETFRQMVQDAVESTWETYSSLEFTNWGQCGSDTRGIRIQIADINPRALLGKRIDGVRNGMVLNSTFTNYSPICQNPSYYDFCVWGIAVHEFGHALGYAHEQNRPDTPDECTEPAQGPDGTVSFGLPWDDQSVMNYCNPAWWYQGHLSRYDVYALQQIYGVPS